MSGCGGATRRFLHAPNRIDAWLTGAHRMLDVPGVRGRLDVEQPIPDDRNDEEVGHPEVLDGPCSAVAKGDSQDVEIRWFLIHPVRNRWAERGADETGGSVVVDLLRVPLRIAPSDRWKW